MELSDKKRWINHRREKDKERKKRKKNTRSSSDTNIEEETLQVNKAERVVEREDMSTTFEGGFEVSEHENAETEKNKEGENTTEKEDENKSFERGNEEDLDISAIPIIEEVDYEDLGDSDEDFNEVLKERIQQNASFGNLSFIPDVEIDKSSTNSEMDDEEEVNPVNVSFRIRSENDLDPRTKEFFIEEMPSNLEKEQEFFKSGNASKRLDEALNSSDYVPCNPLIAKILQEMPPKDFSFCYTNKYGETEFDSNTELFILLQKQLREFGAYKGTDRPKGTSFTEAATRININDKNVEEKFFPRNWQFLYCPFHKEYQFYTQETANCNHEDCNKKLESVNTFTLLYLPDVISIILSDKLIFKMLLNNNKAFKKIFEEV